jgi:hypothetical protein
LFLTALQIAAMLPSKTFPANSARASADPRKEEKRKAKNTKARERAKKRKQRADHGEAPPRKKSQRATVEEVPDEGEPDRRGNVNSSGAKVRLLLNAIRQTYK